MIRRVLFVVVGVALALVGGASVALADEITEHLERQAGQVYSGEQSVVCVNPDGRQSDVFEIGQNAEGVTVTRDQQGTVRVGSADRDETWDAGTGYSLSGSTTTRFLDRTVDQIDVMDGDVLRVRLRFDAVTGVLLASDIFNADGTTYCSTRFVSFVEGDPGIAAGQVPVDGGASPVALEADAEIDAVLPALLAGFDRIRVTDGPQATVVSAFYGDGVFTFTLLNSVNSIAVPELELSGTVDFSGREYRRSFQMGRAVYSWNSAQGGYVMVGDVPMDIQERILSELPEPASQSFFRRLWRGLFG